MKSVAGTEAATPPEDPALRFIRLELAPSRERWIATLGFTGLALIGVLATVTFRIPYPVLVFAGILLLTVPPAHRPFHQAAEVTGAAFFGAGFAILLAVTTYDQPWLYLPLQCAGADGAAGAFPHHRGARAPSSWPRWSCRSPSPPTCPTRREQLTLRCFNALALAGTAWVVATAAVHSAPPPATAEAPAPPGRGELVGFAMLALSAIGLQMLLYNTINLPEIRTGVIAVLLTADPDLRAVWRRMPLRQLCAAGCAALALLMIAVGAPLMDDLGFFAVIAAGCYFAAGWVAHGGPRIAFAAVPGAVTVTLVLLLDVRFAIDIVPSLLNVAGACGDFLSPRLSRCCWRRWWSSSDRTPILACGRSDGEGQRGRAVEDGSAGVDLDGERARIVTLGGEEVDEIGDATAVAGQRAVISGLRRRDEGNGELMLREGRLEVGIGGPHLGLARELQRVEIGPRLVPSRLGFAHPVVPDEAVEQLPAELQARCPPWFSSDKTSCRWVPD